MKTIILKTTSPYLRIILISVLSIMFFSSNAQSSTYFYLKLSSLSLQPEMQLDTIANDSSYILNFNNPQIDTIFSKYKVFTFGQAFPQSQKPENLKYFVVGCDSSKLILDILLYLGSYFTSAEAFTPDYFFCHTPNDYPTYPNTNFLPYQDLINAKGAWDFSIGDPNIKIGIADEFCLTSHEDLNGKITVIGTMGSSSVGGIPRYHGTMVTGAAVAQPDNGVGIAGIGYNCNVLFYDYGFWSGNPTYTAEPFRHLYELANAGANIISISNGSCSTAATNAGQAVMDELYERGIVVIAAAGNGSYEPGNACPDNNGGRNGYVYPASYDHVISVTSVGSLLPYGTLDPSGKKKDWQDMHQLDADDPTITHTHNDKVDICAPGWAVLSTTSIANNAYSQGPGTSFATPIVAGTCGLLLSINPCFTPDEVEDILKSTAYDLNNITENQQFNGLLGAGRLDAAAACSLATILSADQVISNGQNITWSGHRIVAHKLTIETGGTLTITGTVNMGKDARIIIQRGGKLILDGATLTTGCKNAMWNGIEVWGDPAVDQHTTSSHGWIEIKNGSLVEHAKDAIYTGRTDQNNDWVWSHTGGGIVQAFNSTFRNNGRSVQIMSFHNPKVNGKEPSNVNVFKNCVFETTKRLQEDLYLKNGVYCAPTYFVTVWDVKGMRFLGNTFRNDGLDEYPTSVNAPERLGGGVLFFGASCVFDDYIPTCTNCTPIHNTFNNLYRGLDNWGTNSLTSMNIKNCSFINVNAGITLNGVRGDKILGNTFDTDNELRNDVQNLAHIQTQQSASFLITENTFNKTSGTIINSFATVIDNTSYTGGDLFKNTYRSLVWGLETNNDNQYLKVQCNDFDNLWRDWNSNRIGFNGSRPSQNVFNSLSGWWCANNHFDNNCTSQNYEHIYNTNPSGIALPKHELQYYSGNEVRPPADACVSAPTVGLSHLAGNNLEGCASKVVGNNGAIQTDIVSKQVAATGKIALINGGRTNDLLNIVNDPLADEQALHDTLILYSPFLSDEVLTACINRSTFHDSYLFDILVLHSGLNTQVQEALDNRSPAMLQGLYDSLIIWQDSIAARDTLEAQIHSLLRDAQIGLNELLRNYEDSGLVDSIIYQLSLLSDVNSKGKYINMLIEEGDFNTASAQIVNLDSNDPEQGDLQTFESIHLGLKNGGNNWFSVTLNQRDELRELATHENSVAKYAQAVLILIEDTMIYVFPDTTIEAPYGPVSQPQSTQRVNRTFSQMLVFPNPFTNATTIEYRLPFQSKGAVSFKIYSIQGRLIKEINLGLNKSGKVNVSLDEVAVGMYIAQLVQNGVVIKTQKLVKQL